MRNDGGEKCTASKQEWQGKIERALAAHANSITIVECVRTSESGLSMRCGLAISYITSPPESEQGEGTTKKSSVRENIEMRATYRGKLKAKKLERAMKIMQEHTVRVKCK